MKRKFIIATLASLLVLNFGCENYLDVNHDPNVLEQIPDAKVLIPSAEVGIANQLMGWDMGFAGAFWCEYWTQTYTASQFKSLCEYKPNSFSTAYGGFTSGALADLNRVKKISTDPVSAGNYFIAEALSIYTWQVMTDTWGSIPYFEALKADQGIVSPKFDSGQDIYADLMKRCDALLAVDLSKAYVDEKYDFIYKGDLTKWTAFLNSLKLKLMIRLSETSSYDNAAVLAFIQGNTLLTSSAKISGSVWSDALEGKRHPMREYAVGDASYFATNVIACKTFIDYLSTNNDPRINTLYVPKGTPATFKGAFFGDFDSKENSDNVGPIDALEPYSTIFPFSISIADMAAISNKSCLDLMIMSDWEVYFYIAEVYARASNNVKAKEYYDLGVQASLRQHGVATNDIILPGGYAAWVDGSPEAGIKQIAMQKWVANAHYQHAESFIERNRTKYPAVNTIDIKNDRKFANTNFPVGDLTLSVAGRVTTNGQLPSSPTYPTSVLTRNQYAPAQKADMLQKVWWDKKAGL